MNKETQKPKPLTQEELEVFESAFRTCGSCKVLCECGRIFYNSTGGWDWKDGELERLHADENTTDVDCTIGRIGFEGGSYADSCDCWHERAARIYRWLINYRYQVCDLYSGIKNMKLKEAASFPVPTTTVETKET